MGIPGFILKIALLSLGLSLAIKYGGPWLNVPAEDAIALVAILFPAVLMGILLFLRSRQNQQLSP